MIPLPCWRGSGRGAGGEGQKGGREGRSREGEPWKEKVWLIEERKEKVRLGREARE